MSTNEAPMMSYEKLQKVIKDNAAALRCRRRLQPAGGKGDKVFPPTYMGGKYAMEERVIDGKRIPCVLLDSVQSQANRMELALLEATRSGSIQVPLVAVDFSGTDADEVGKITSLEAPHRLADAILRDSNLNGVPFRYTEQGKCLNSAKITNATELLGLCPTALLFGVWDSTGPLGGLGTKFQRVMISEIAGMDVKDGAKPAIRMDPLGIQKNAGPLFATAGGGWTLNEKEALKEKGKPVLFKDGDPSSAVHGNIPSKWEGLPGGVTMDHALQTVVISLPALRRLRFPLNGKKDAADLEARTVLAALGLCAATLSIEAGCDLRSRCLLVPEPDQSGWEVVKGDGVAEGFALDAEKACELLNVTVAAAKKAGLPWMDKPLVLKPSEGLVTLVKKSRELAMQAGAETTEA